MDSDNIDPKKSFNERSIIKDETKTNVRSPVNVLRPSNVPLGNNSPFAKQRDVASQTTSPRIVGEQLKAGYSSTSSSTSQQILKQRPIEPILLLNADHSRLRQRRLNRDSEKSRKSNKPEINYGNVNYAIDRSSNMQEKSYTSEDSFKSVNSTFELFRPKTIYNRRPYIGHRIDSNSSRMSDNNDESDSFHSFVTTNEFNNSSTSSNIDRNYSFQEMKTVQHLSRSDNNIQSKSEVVIEMEPHNILHQNQSTDFRANIDSRSVRGYCSKGNTGQLVFNTKPLTVAHVERSYRRPDLNTISEKKKPVEDMMDTTEHDASPGNITNAVNRTFPLEIINVSQQEKVTTPKQTLFDKLLNSVKKTPRKKAERTAVISEGDETQEQAAGTPFLSPIRNLGSKFGFNLPKKKEDTPSHSDTADAGRFSLIKKSCGVSPCDCKRGNMSFDERDSPHLTEVHRISTNLEHLKLKPLSTSTPARNIYINPVDANKPPVAVGEPNTSSCPSRGRREHFNPGKENYPPGAVGVPVTSLRPFNSSGSSTYCSPVGLNYPPGAVRSSNVKSFQSTSSVMVKGSSTSCSPVRVNYSQGTRRSSNARSFLSTSSGSSSNFHHVRGNHPTSAVEGPNARSFPSTSSGSSGFVKPQGENDPPGAMGGPDNSPSLMNISDDCEMSDITEKRYINETRKRSKIFPARRSSIDDSRTDNLLRWNGTSDLSFTNNAPERRSIRRNSYDQMHLDPEFAESVRKNEPMENYEIVSKDIKQTAATIRENNVKLGLIPKSANMPKEGEPKRGNIFKSNFHKMKRSFSSLSRTREISIDPQESDSTLDNLDSDLLPPMRKSSEQAVKPKRKRRHSFIR